MAHRCVFLHPRWQVGGVERTNLQWAKVLESQGAKCLLLTTSDKDETVEYDRIKGWATRGRIKLLRLAMSAVQRGDTLIVCQSYPVLWLVPLLLALRIRGVHLWLAERNAFAQYDEYPIKKWLYSWLFPWLLPSLFDEIIVNSEELRNSFPYSEIQDVSVVINPRFDGDELTRYQQTRRYTPTEIVAFVRWSSQKDTDFMVRAAPIIREKGFDFKVFCGRSDFDFQKKFVDDPLKYVCENTCALLFCSKFEGYPNVLLEARAAGIPIVYAPCPTGVREVLSGYENSIQFEKHDEESFRRALGQLNRLYVTRIDYECVRKHSVKTSSLANLIRQ